MVTRASYSAFVHSSIFLLISLAMVKPFSSTHWLFFIFKVFASSFQSASKIFMVAFDIFFGNREMSKVVRHSFCYVCECFSRSYGWKPHNIFVLPSGLFKNRSLLKRAPVAPAKRNSLSKMARGSWSTNDGVSRVEEGLLPTFKLRPSANECVRGGAAEEVTRVATEMSTGACLLAK